MSKNGINVDAFCESAYYFKEGKMILDRPVLAYDDIDKRYDRYELVLGASGKSIQNIIRNEGRKQNKIFVFDNTKPLFEMTSRWVKDNVGELQKTFDLLEDDLSRSTFYSFLQDKANCLNIKTEPLWKLWVDGQYFNDLYNPVNYHTNVMVDCGAWIGDTAEEFLEFLKKDGYEGVVHAFEPEPDNYIKLEETAKRVGNIYCYKYAVGNEKKKVSFAVGNSSTSHLSACKEFGSVVDMMPVDEVLKDEVVSFIKMDLEGGEENALMGMKNLIARSAPYMAICVYHKVDDLIRLPRSICKLTEKTGESYKYYLRHHSSTSYETVFYAVPQCG